MQERRRKSCINGIWSNYMEREEEEGGGEREKVGMRRGGVVCIEYIYSSCDY